NWQEFPFFQAATTMHQKIAISDLASHFVVHGIIQLLIIASGVWLILRKNRTTVFYARWITILIIADLVIAARLNFFGTVASDQNPATIRTLIEDSPRGFPLPDLTVEVGRNRDQNPDYHPLWKNTNIFTKNISAEGFNSFRLDQFDHFFIEYPAVAKSLLELPPLFISAHLLPESQMEKYKEIKPPPKSIFVPDSVALNFITSGDPGNSRIRLLRFDPTLIEASVDIQKNGILVLQQQYFRGWKAYMNGKPTTIYRVNRLCMGLLIPPGTHEVRFVYRNPVVKAGFAVSYFVFAILLTSVVFIVVRTQFPTLQRLALVSAITVMLFFAFATVYFSTRERYEVHLTDEYRNLALKLKNIIEKPSEAKIVLNIEQPELFLHLMSDADNGLLSNHLRFYDRRKISQLAEHLNYDTSSQLIYVSHNLHHREEATELIRYHFPGMEVIYKSQRSQIVRFRREATRSSLHSTLLNMESKLPNWSYDIGQRSEDHFVSGSYSLPLNETQPGGPAWVVKAGDLRIDSFVRVVADARVLHSTGADAALYIVVEREGVNIWQRTVSSAKFKETDKEWAYVFLVADPPFKIQPSDKLKVFFWINGTKQLWIDDFRITVFQAKQ
ncbi:MAG TPA: YfhO family protein, partial [Bacteroidales bacterium]|nr:YfhO family protein [Bacteroidales bacterium]